MMMRHAKQARARIVTSGAAVVAVLLAARPADAEPLLGLPTGIGGVNPQLVPSPDGSSIYLFAASDNTAVLRFDVQTEQWDGSIPALSTPSVDLNPASCYDGQCWGGPAYAVGPNSALHVVWGQKGYNDCWPGHEFDTSVRLIHERYNGSWASPEIIVERTAGSDRCGYQYPGLADDGQGNLVLIYQNT
jgi:hypothetical protein